MNASSPKSPTERTANETASHSTDDQPFRATSANRSDEADARDAAEIASRLGDAVALVLDGGPIRGGPASTVVDCSVALPVVLRARAIPPAEIAAGLDASGIAHAIET